MGFHGTTVAREFLRSVEDAGYLELRDRLWNLHGELFVKKNAPGAKIRLHHDFETFSEVDLLKVGSSKYSRDQSTEVLMAAWAFGDTPIEQWSHETGRPFSKDLLDGMADPDVVKFAWNKPFEWAIWSNTLGVKTPHEEWRDPMVLAYSCSLPGALAKAGPILGVDSDKTKDTRGRLLIKTFCKPRKPTKKLTHTRDTWETQPEKWEEFLEYNRQDVEAERHIWKLLRKYNMAPWEWSMWFLDQAINTAGIPINMKLVNNAIRVFEEFKEDTLHELRGLTGLANPNSRDQFLGWAKTEGYVFDDLVKGHVARGLEMAEENNDLGQKDDLIRGLILRQRVSATSPTKFAALKRATDDDGHIRNAFQFRGASRTGRYAGRLFQAQNLPKPADSLVTRLTDHVHNMQFLDYQSTKLVFGDTLEILKSCIRPAAAAPEGHTFCDADLNAIENRILGWISGDKKILRVFELGRDPYIDFATHMFKQDYDTLKAEHDAGDSSKRKISKPGVLGCGYKLSAGKETRNKKTHEMEATGLLGYSRNMGVEMTPAESELSVSVWRRTYSKAVESWAGIEKAVKRCIRTGKAQEYMMFIIDRKGPFLRIRLPSGRFLHYVRPRLEQWKMPWGKYRESVTYEGLNDKGQWVRIATHGGKLIENVDQAIAADVLNNGMMIAHQEGLDIRLHVHDQVLVKSTISEAEEKLEILKQCMCVPPIWAPDLPLAADGFLSPIFTKD